MPSLPKKSLSRPWGIKRTISESTSIFSKASETASTQSEPALEDPPIRKLNHKSSSRDLASSASVQTPETESDEACLSTASSLAEFAKLKQELADTITTSSDSKQKTHRRKPVKRPAAAQIFTELKSKDEESQSRFRRQSLNVTKSKSAPYDLANIMMHYPGLHKSKSSSFNTAMNQEGAFQNIVEEDKVGKSSDEFQPDTASNYNSPIDEQEEEDLPGLKVSAHSSSDFKVSELAPDYHSVAQADDFNDPDASVVFLSRRVCNEIERQPTTRFRIHAANLAVHSPVLVEMCDMLRKSIEEQVEIPLQEDADTLKLLFGLMYNKPAARLSPDDWQRSLSLAESAEKYNVARAKDTAIAYFVDQERREIISPFVTYAFATKYNLPDLEKSSAERSASFDINALPESIFNLIGYAGFQKLAAYHSTRQAYYSDVLNSIVIDPRDLAEQCYQSNGTCVVLPWNNLKQKLAWSKADRKQLPADRRVMRPDHVMAQLVSEIGEIDCGTCCRALVQAALVAKRALETTPLYEV